MSSAAMHLAARNNESIVAIVLPLGRYAKARITIIIDRFGAYRYLIIVAAPCIYRGWMGHSLTSSGSFRAMIHHSVYPQIGTGKNRMDSNGRF